MRFGDLLKETFDAFKQQWKLFVSIAFLLSFLPALVIVLVYVWFYGTAVPTAITLFDLVAMFISTLLVVLLTLSVLESLRKKPKTVKHALKAGSGRFWDGILLTLLMTVALFFLFLLLIIPGIVFSIYWVFAYYALVLDNKGIVGSLRYSTKLVRGRWWQVFGYAILLTLIVIGAGMIFVLPIAFTAAALFLMNSVIGSVLLVITYVLQAALEALAVLFLLLFFERMYVQLKQGKK